jgi:hypothetical protein
MLKNLKIYINLNNFEMKNYKINNEYFINLDNFIPLKKLKKIENDITKGVVLSEKYWEINILDEKSCFYDKNFEEASPYFINVFKNTNDYLEMKKQGLSDDEIFKIIKFSKPIREIGTKRLFLRKPPLYNKFFGLKHKQRGNKDQNCIIHFESLINWITESNIFKEVGRIVIFVNNRGDSIPIHSDYADGETRKDQFIWINLNKKKDFFILTEESKKIYPEGEVSIFDNANWHGSEPSEYPCYTIRIDGLFTDEFLNLSGLFDHFIDQ